MSVQITNKSEQFIKHVLNELEMFMEKVLVKLERDAIRIIDANKLIASNQMRRNIRHEVIIQAGKIFGIFGVGGNVLSTNRFPYPIAVHEGTRPHFPPLREIQRWVIRKGLVKMNSRSTSIRGIRGAFFSGGKKRQKAIDVMKEVRNVAYLIARKISQQGTTGVAFLRMALNQNVNWIASQLATIKI